MRERKKERERERERKKEREGERERERERERGRKKEEKWGNLVSFLCTFKQTMSEQRLYSSVLCVVHYVK